MLFNSKPTVKINIREKFEPGETLTFTEASKDIFCSTTFLKLWRP